MSDNIRQQILIVEEDINVNVNNSEIQKLSEIEELKEYVYGHYKDFDSFDIYAPGRHLESLQNDIHLLAQVKRITFYFNSKEEMNQAKRAFGTEFKFRFGLTLAVANRIHITCIHRALNSSATLDTDILKKNFQEEIQRIKTKQASLHSNSSSLLFKCIVGFDVQNLDTIPEQYLCEICGYILREPYQLSCGHRCCISCLEFLKE